MYMTLEPIKQLQLFWVVCVHNSFMLGNLSAFGHGRRFDH